MADAETPDEKRRLCEEWLVRNTALLDQLEKRFQDVYPITSARQNLENMIEIESRRFAIEVHRWELDTMLETGSFDDYPQKSENS